MTLPDGTSVEYIHDPLGRRIARKVNGAVVEKYLWQGMTRLLAVYDGSNSLLMRFEYADARMPFAVTMGGVLYYMVYDQVGSLRVVADTSGNAVKRIDYDSFGNIISDTNPGFAVPFGFAGRLHDKDTKLVRFGYRDYDPETGRWTAKDPIGFAGGDTDLYGYCVNDPVNFVDALGLECLVCNRKATGVVGALGGNHAYLWDTTADNGQGEGYGMQGSSGSGAHTKEAGPATDACAKVEGSAGKEADMMNFMRENADNGMWFPCINDCHNAVKDAVGSQNLAYPGAPGGRVGRIPGSGQPSVPRNDWVPYSPNSDK